MLALDKPGCKISLIDEGELTARTNRSPNRDIQRVNCFPGVWDC